MAPGRAPHSVRAAVWNQRLLPEIMESSTTFIVAANRVLPLSVESRRGKRAGSSATRVWHRLRYFPGDHRYKEAHRRIFQKGVLPLHRFLYRASSKDVRKTG